MRIKYAKFMCNSLISEANINDNGHENGSAIEIFYIPSNHPGTLVPITLKFGGRFY